MVATPVFQAAIYGLHGFTLVEVLMGLSILSVAVALASRRLFRVFSFHISHKNKAVATKDQRHADSSFSSEAQNAQAAWDENGDAVDLLSASDSVTLSWTGSDGNMHSSISQITGDSFERH